MKVGDRVRAEQSLEENVRGKYGTIVRIEKRSGRADCVVEFDEAITDGHNGDGSGKSGHCWWIWEDRLELVVSSAEEQKIEHVGYIHTHTITSGGAKMELENIKSKNLKEAKKQYDKEKTNAEIEFAKEQLAKAHDEIDRIDREIPG